MSWDCAFCAREERPDGSVRVEAVCHHCGALLCDEETYVVWDTDVLGSPAGGQWAVHCWACRHEWHRFALPGRRAFAR
jgi:hypothetical protein